MIKNARNRRNDKQLLNEMGFIPSEKDERDYEIEVEGGYAHVDFRERNGRRWAKVNGVYVKDPDSIPILKAFKEARDKLQSLGASKHNDLPEEDIIRASSGGSQSPQTASKNGDTGKQREAQQQPGRGYPSSPGLDATKEQAVTMKETSNHQPTPENKKPAPSNPNLYEFFFELVGAGGIIELFGDTGTLKSQLCTETCKDVSRLGKTFFYLDTEGKVGLFNKKSLGNNYVYIPIWNEIVNKIAGTWSDQDKCLVGGLPKYNLLILDSIGFPISAKTAGMRLDEQGQAWNDMMSLVGDYIKAWAYKNDAIVLVTNQPKSEFMKSEEEKKRLDAVGDKVHFGFNLIIKSFKSIIPGHYDKQERKAVPPTSIGTFLSHRSTDFMDDSELLSIRKNDDDIIVQIPVPVINRLKKLKEA